jgi:L-threonylcarbamoyladenylate synthase
MMSKRHTIRPDRPQPDIICAAADVIRNNGVVIMPTHGLYGLGADAVNATAVQRIFHIKKRPLHKPLLVLISHRRMLSDIVVDVPPLAGYLMDLFWPGRITLVMTGRAGLAPGLCSRDGKVGVRLAGHPVAAALVNAVGRPITGTSANLSGAGGRSRVGAIEDAVIASVEMVLDAGPLEGGPGSTVVDVTAEPPVVLRHGTVPGADIHSAFDQYVANPGKCKGCPVSIR